MYFVCFVIHLPLLQICVNLRNLRLKIPSFPRSLSANATCNTRLHAEAAKEIPMSGADADTVEEAVIAMLINRAMEVVNQDKITPSLYREVVGLVVRLREQRISMERLRLELDVADLVLKHLHPRTTRSGSTRHQVTTVLSSCIQCPRNGK